MLGKEKACCPPSSSTRIKSLATVVTDLQYILKGIQREGQDEALFALGKPAELTHQMVMYFKEKIL